MLEQQIFEKALNLPPATRLDLVKKIVASLKQEKSHFFVEWAEEAERRVNAYEAGLTSAKSTEEVLVEYKNKE